MSCEKCTDPDGVACFPQYGLAPHIHVPDGIAFYPDTGPMAGFTPSATEPFMGTYWCPYCGDGKPTELAARGEGGQS